MDFHNKTAVVTGGATGIGKAVCLMLAGLGSNIVLNYAHSKVDAQETEREIQKLGGRVLAVRTDVSDDGQVRGMMDQAAERFGGIDFLVNNASITEQIELPDLEAVTDAVWDSLIAVNVKGMFYCARAAALVMKAHGGSILNMGSIAGITGRGSSMPYAVSKAAVHCLTKSLAHALAPEIRVNCIAPAAVSTRWWKGEEEKMIRLSGHLPLQRISTPEDIAELICAILSQKSITGQVISPNNGMVI
ncbi:SDR family NAD(P)-dependent oxidoreductase [Ethanoligenens harbinense]|uniref:Short-chain dehydrogenase/reductase SDR n=2 Tax=Ethanoligenens harbinense TaxID=253239 RepID=E6U5L4_ETHHY|nr:SDR family oxidoreductase [Ethanoligenens harbinense]ADU26773.1 short-chain dehydrogenase/reductase SDR [Ethanoligenens harbinense YUAN-3]AVQ95880.1 NAD(P)-dependent oxidoreductase [Ethanoligenens harbinense YUAN-3]AYF38542.1 NAD(P)-dependent oxidoreductase [Ethanoligenens harbinense]QCN92121.1 SDR family NAD(P)-dependent oxidoreductase [Ethanoligenens harbinense]